MYENVRQNTARWKVQGKKRHGEERLWSCRRSVFFPSSYYPTRSLPVCHTIPPIHLGVSEMVQLLEGLAANTSDLRSIPRTHK